MGEVGCKIRNQNAIHFITFATVEWVDFFTRRKYKELILESLRYCQKAIKLNFYFLGIQLLSNNSIDNNFIKGLPKAQ